MRWGPFDGDLEGFALMFKVMKPSWSVFGGYTSEGIETYSGTL